MRRTIVVLAMGTQQPQDNRGNDSIRDARVDEARPDIRLDRQEAGALREPKAWRRNLHTLDAINLAV